MDPREPHSRKRHSTGLPEGPETPPTKIRQHDELQSAPGTYRSVGSPQTLSQTVDEAHFARIKGRWRQCQSLDEFAELTGLDRKRLNTTLGNLWEEMEGCVTFKDWIFMQADNYLHVAKQAIQNRRDASDIRWLESPLSNEAEDEAMVIYVEFWKIKPCWSPMFIHDYIRVLKRFLFVDRNLSHDQDTRQIGEMRNAAAEAFHQKPVPGRDVVSSIYETIKAYYGKYNSEKHFAPYTSLVGPSGVGKSYIVQLLAKKVKVYVVYVSLAGKLAEAYPRRSAIADRIDQFDKREEMTTFFECFIAASMSFVQLSREHGITPAAFYDLQVMEKHHDFQRRLAAHVGALFERVLQEGIPHREGRPREKSEYVLSQNDGNEEGFDHQGYINKHLEWFHELARPDFAEVSTELNKEPEYDERIEPDLSEDVPSAVICLDEARELFYRSRDPQMRFLAFRRAMRHRSRLSVGLDTKSFFALMLDTSAQVSDFSPPWSHDRSAKSVSMRPSLHPEMMIEQYRPDMLFPPIFKIDTMDIFSAETIPAPDDGKRDGPDISSRLFRLGRPLWGSLLKSRGVPHVLNLAAEKIRGGPHQRVDEDPDTRLIALMSYRLGFYIALPSLSESLASGYLRYIVGINDRRTLLRTFQPSEPILAHVSAQETFRRPDMRLAMVQAVYRNIMNGVIHVGDIGEAVAAMILLFTQDRIQGTGYPRPVSLGRFLCSLLPLSISGPLQERARASKQMGDLWNHGRVMFNHFTRVTEMPTLETLQKAYERAAVLLPPYGYKGADIIIPVALPGDKMSFLIVQVKNRRGDSLTSGLKDEARFDLQSAARLLDGKIPHMALMMSLRANQATEKVEIVEPRENTPAPTTRNRRAQASSRFLWESQKRILVATVGFSLQNFPGISFGNNPETETQTIGVVELLKSLLDCTGEVNLRERDAYLKHLLPLG